MINVEMTKANGVTLATENTICNENVKVTIANGENLKAENIKKDVQIADVVGTLESSDVDYIEKTIKGEVFEYVIPTSITKLRYSGIIFTNISKLTIHEFVETIDSLAVSSNEHLEELIILSKGREIASGNSRTFGYNENLKKVYIGKDFSFNIYGYNASFHGSSKMENFVVEKGFKSFLCISQSTLFTRETLRAIIDNYADRTGQSALTFTIGSTNLAKLTEEDIAVATNKNITLA